MEHQRFKNLLLMIAIICSISARGITQITYDGYKYSIDEATHTATLERQNNSSLQSVSIPGTVYYDGQSYTVTAVAGHAFYNCRQLTNVSLPSTITSIGDYAFGNCNVLVSINIPEGVTTIGSNAFYYCRNLTNVTLPGTLTSLGRCAFEDCSSLTNITIPNGLKIIEYGAFEDCSNLQKVTLPNSITSIGQRAFWYCSNLLSINLPDGITSIGSAAFSWCQKLTSITLPAKLKKIEHSSFSCCSSLTSINIPGEVRSIADNAFGACSSLNSINIPKKLTNISPTAFSSCKLTSITVAEGNPVYDSRQSCNAIIETASNRLILGTPQTVIPDNIVEIGTQAFYNCRDLLSVKLPSTVRTIGDEAFASCYDLQEIILNEGLAEIGTRAFSWCSKITSFEIPQSVHYIGGQAFQGCQNLKEFQWPVALSCISDSVFQNCTGLTSFTVPETVKSIGKASFMGCTGLLNISIPSSVTSIGDDAFNNCNSFISFEVPASVTKLGKRVFAYCDNLATLSVADGNPVYDSREACNAIIETESNTLIMSINNTTIPSTVTAIGDYAFQSSKVSNLSFPNGLTSIGDYAFSFCQNLTTLVLPEGFQALGNSAFFASKLESVELPSTMKKVGNTTFYNCPSLKTVVLPASIETLESWAFMSCQNVTDYYCYRATPPSFGSLAIQTFTATLHVPAAAIAAYKADSNWGQFSKIVPINEGIVTYSYDPATLTATLTGYTNSGENEVILHSTTSYNGQIYQVKKIDSNVFCKHMEMQSVSLPDSLVEIGTWTFSDCSSLRKITLPASVRTLGEHVFNYCESLTDIYSFASVVPETGESIINNSYLSKVTLHVPLNLIQQYKQHEVWGKFGKIVPLESLGMPNIYFEYFVDKDPGLGRGNKIAIGKTDGEFSYTFYSEYEYMYDQSIFHTGVNNMGMRLVSIYDDGTTTYSPTDMIQVYRNTPVGKTDSSISYVEYFWDEDPGYGNGTQLSFTYDNNDVVVDTEIEQGSLRGEHTFFVRARSGNNWSIIGSQTVVLQSREPLSGLIVLDPTVTEDQEQGRFSLLSSLLGALSTRGFTVGVNVNVADNTYNFIVSEESLLFIQKLYGLLVEKNFYLSMKAPKEAVFNFIMPEEFIMIHEKDIPQIVAAVQAMFSHILTENISILINGQVYQYDGFQVEPNDLMALKNMYNRLGGENWTVKKWSFKSNGRDKDELPGVTFSEEGRVREINLSNNGLVGELGSWELILPELRVLSLDRNRLTGDVAPFVSELTKLSSLDLCYNRLTEVSKPLPKNIGTLNLQSQFRIEDDVYGVYNLLEPFDSAVWEVKPIQAYISEKQTLSLPTILTYKHKEQNYSNSYGLYLYWHGIAETTSAWLQRYGESYEFKYTTNYDYAYPQDEQWLIAPSRGEAAHSAYPVKVHYMEGDANMSGYTDVLDVQHTLNYILSTVKKFNYSAANTYIDKQINVQDIVCTVNIVLDNELNTTASARSASAMPSEEPQGWLYTRNGQLQLMAAADVAAIDMELSGVKTSQVSLLLNHSQFQLIGRNTPTGSRYVIYSPTGQTIPAGEATALLKLSAQAEVVAAQAADIAAEEVRMALGEQPTGISQLMSSALKARFQGNSLVVTATTDVEHIALQLVTVGGATVYSTELPLLRRGETVFETAVAPGIYLLEMATKSGSRKMVKLMKK